MKEQFNKLNSSEMNSINLVNRINQLGQSPSNITYYQNNSPNNNSLLNSILSDSLNNSLMNNDEVLQQPMENGNGSEYESETPKMSINFNMNNKEFNEGISHEDALKEKSITETKTTTNKANSDIKIEAIPVPTIENIVSTAKLNCELKLKEIAVQEINTQYNPKRFSGLIMRIKEPKATSLIFSNGKIIVLGAKTEEDSFKACKKIAKIIGSLNYTVKLTEFKIQNIVGSCDSKFKINLHRLSNYIKGHVGGSRVAFEPEVFPGLIYRLIPYKSQNNESNENLANIVLLIFNSGKIVICGAKNRNQIYEAFKKVYPLLYQAKIDNIPKGKKIT